IEKRDDPLAGDLSGEMQRQDQAMQIGAISSDNPGIECRDDRRTVDSPTRPEICPGYPCSSDSYATVAPACEDCSSPRRLPDARRAASPWCRYRESTVRSKAVAWCNQDVPAA